MTDKLPEVGKRYRHCTNHIPCEVEGITDKGYIFISWVNSPELREDIFYPNSFCFWETFEEIPEEKQNEWQPIETAPKKKYLLVTSITSDHQPCVGYYGKSNINLPEDWFSDLLNMARTPLPYIPTHWMPLPKPPVDNNK